MIDPTAANQAAVIGLGANMENPRQVILAALERLKATRGLIFLGRSSIYLTEPQGGPAGQNWFHNAAAFFESALPAEEILEKLLAIESDFGRIRREPNGPRIIDLDLLALGRQVIDDPPRLIVPHPRMHQRLFVMAPLSEAAPGWRHPLSGLSALELLSAIPPAGQGFRKLDELEV